jgi:diaminobutyrate-2-oxoglutarate transaminase
MYIFEKLESNVRSYIRSFPAIFDRAEGACIYDERGNLFIDFLAGAGTLNYGHNNPWVTDALIQYLQRNGILQSLDKATVAKRNFLKKFSETILAPRKLEYKVQFTGPTGTNSVEASLKLARLVKKRRNIVAFTNAYHGLSMGSLEATGHHFYRNLFYSARFGVDHMPFDGYLGRDVNTIDYLRKVLNDASSGIDLPAAILVETIQCEGGINVASNAWLQELQTLCREFDLLLIIDDIQVGNGRTGQFFSFEEAGLSPDMICLSKSIGGGLPMSLLLLSPEIDQWQPGEHTGTFRGNNLAFIAATEILSQYWETDDLTLFVQRKGKIVQESLQQMASDCSKLDMRVRGRGMVWGLEIPEIGFASEVSAKAFEKQLIIETCGSKNQVLKLLPPLTIEEDLLREGLKRLAEAINEVAFPTAI